mmetsp:Transcript_9491/g.21736  ORF Transcript_9491/g.21736 Transcript_9491/m.21736 type:complete len:362 (-) Transcript_9491:144-1229(-)|eukprot:CAMPEP_0114557422 /NCGR_PEP_ID=MMETSP0114-20121206/9824_1 /TAXON_ID=31324 /ORGANISM="Goniomonas sp, Strain m" /LENGTH=361 /DNA_ID=CAMNT_0001742713 /DNA_START=22 /DNA_END=1107 /DNA_ORIENTATION=+
MAMPATTLFGVFLLFMAGTTLAAITCTTGGCIAAGGDCSQSNAKCGPGLYCDSTSLKCTAYPEPGSACTTVGNQCGSGNYICFGSPLQCREYRTAGMECFQSQQCFSNVDAAGFVNCPSTGICPVVSNGGACVVDSDCGLGNGNCDTTSKVCVAPRLAEGAACTSTSRCADGLTCAGTTTFACTRKYTLATGAPACPKSGTTTLPTCASACQSTVTDSNGACQAYVAPSTAGKTCSVNSECTATPFSAVCSCADSTSTKCISSLSTQTECFRQYALYTQCLSSMACLRQWKKPGTVCAACCIEYRSLEACWAGAKLYPGGPTAGANGICDLSGCPVESAAPSTAPALAVLAVAVVASLLAL